jgi:ornithine cyclodeaminase
MRQLDAAETRAALPMATAIEAMGAAFGDDREVPVRHVLGSSAFMTGRVGDISGVKVVSLVPGNPAGIVAVFDRDGEPMGIVDGPTLTAIRTGAGCGLATRLLSSPASSVLAILGAGAMAFDQVDAVRAVRPIERVLVWSRSPERASALAERVGGEVVADPDEAVSAADVVTTVTPSRLPLFQAAALVLGTHVNAVGAFTPEMCELPPDLVRSAFIVVDDRAAAAAEAGDLIQAGRQPDAEMSDLIAGRVTKPQGATTVFKSVGIASQDVAAAVAALRGV